MKETVRPQDNVAGRTHQPEKLAGAPLYSVGWMLYRRFATDSQALA